MKSQPIEIRAYFVPEAELWFAVLNHAPAHLYELSGTG
jgi:hypothetical protein